MNRVIEGINSVRIGVHVCRGNWSTQEGVHLSGDYERMLPGLKAMHVKQFVLEYATPRAGDIAIVGEDLNDREIGLGTVNPRDGKPEDVDTLVARVERALPYFELRQIFLNPDCGFGTFAHRCVATEQVAFEKMSNLAEAARVLREKHG